MQDETSQLLAGAVEAGQSLSELKIAVAAERANLAEAKRQSDAANALAAEQSRALELLHRRRVYDAMQHSIWAIAYGLSDDDSRSAGPRPRGATIYDFIQTAAPRPGEETAAGAYRRLKEHLPAVCPALRLRTVVLAAPADFDYAVPDRERRFSSQSDLDVYMAGITAQNEKRTKEYRSAVAAQTEKHHADSAALGVFASQCVCRALADQEIGTEEVCPRKPGE